MNFIDTLQNLWRSTGLYQSQYQNYIMLVIACVLFYLAIAKKYEPLLLLPIAFGMFIINIPGAKEILYAPEQVNIINNSDGTISTVLAKPGGLFTYLYMGVDRVIFPPLIFLGIGAMTDFGPLIANPKSLLLGAAAQLGIFVTFVGAILLGIDGAQAAAIAIIGGADGPTAIYVTQMLNQTQILPIIAIAAYSYMALIPVIQPIFMRLLVTKKERVVRMAQLREVSKKERIVFPIVVTLLCGLLLPQAIPLVGMLMLGNLLKESTVTDRLAKTASNELINIVTIMLGVIVGSKADGVTFLAPLTLKIIGLGLAAFCIGTIGGLLMGKLMYAVTKGKVNPLIGSAGVSAVPMAARVSQVQGQKYDPNNYLLMHAMGPNVAGVIGSAVAAGILLSLGL